MIPRLYLESDTPLATGQTRPLEREPGHYLTRVLRLRPGGELRLFDGRGGEWQATLIRTEPHCLLNIGAHLPCSRESPVAITLVQGLIKPNAMELVIQKSVELGVNRILPLLARRSVDRPRERPDRWRRIAIEAAEQCGRDRVAEILPPTPWEALPNLLAEGPRILFWEEARHDSLTALLPASPPPTHLTLLVGPEGGFHPEEAAFAQARLGCGLAGLGPRVLRAETAALAALTAAQLLWGDLG